MASVTEAAQASRNGTTIQVENPATGDVIGEIAVMGEAEISALVARARQAQPGWEALGFDDRIPALAAGNGVILKPSEVTPLSSLLMEEMMRECGLPEGVFQVATGDGSTGAALISKVDCLMFTGSSRTGKAVMKAAADALIPCYLELGGKDPMIVCADANLQRAANAAAFYSMNNAGQVCISVER